MDLLQKEQALQELSGDFKEDAHHSPISPIHTKDGNRLQQIKDQIRSLEKSRLREEIVARRQKKLLVRHARQKYLEEAALREAELLQELDRERTSDVEHEIERLRLLEIERARTRELRHNLDLEKERQTPASNLNCFCCM
ncbi:protein PRRC2C-like [Telopea speciosissima]|uniref:protein PRRC2C-like n=1 Tax=Telopea speciosissima TaxID=54955 RepID=UPI001CC33F03|nr:protein PRRC2C-like [Telopea speciosissima]